MKRVFSRGTDAGAASIGAGVFGREMELDELRVRTLQRKSFLCHGPAGVGKTLLLSLTVVESAGVLYSPAAGTPQELYKNVASALFAVNSRLFTKACPGGIASLDSKSVVALRGIVRDALRATSYVVILDHMQRPSQTLTASVRELMLDCSVPVVSVSRSDHMEDAGFVLPLYPDRSDRMSVQNFDSQAAQQFAHWCARKEQLEAANLDQFLETTAKQSKGNPGAIKRMIQMAKLPKYVSAGQIKSALLYIDFRIAGISQ